MSLCYLTKIRNREDFVRYMLVISEISTRISTTTQMETLTPYRMKILNQISKLKNNRKMILCNIK